MLSRRQFLASGGLSLLALPASYQHGARANGYQERNALPDGGQSKDMITPAAQQAIGEGLSFLVSRQHHDGAFGTQQYHGNVAITSLAALALMAAGHQPRRGAYGRIVEKALRYVVDQDDGRGYLLSKTGYSHGPMYEHGFGTLFLSEVYGMVQDRPLRDQLHETLKRAIKLIVQSQNSEGGWRYSPVSRDADVSVTICQIMALRAARNAGFFVAKATVDRCTSYVKNCQNRDGGFCYQQQGGPSQFARSAAGVVALYSAGIYHSPEITRGLQYLMRFKPRGGLISPDVSLHYFYGHYYAAQAMWTAGGSYWKEWYPAIREELLNHPDRHRQGISYWMDHRFSSDYATAMACIILQIPNNYLPILQV
jgi:Squalene-hopene cyclase C-terminal domain